MSYETDSFDERVVNLLASGRVGLLPTDTIYGISGVAMNQTAVKKIHKLKDRAQHKPFIILISNIEMLNLLSIDKTPVAVIKKYWPGPLTLILQAPSSPSWLNLGTQTLAIRMPGLPPLLELISKTGPLISTSANIEGQDPVKSVGEAKSIFGDQLDFYVDVGQLPNRLPSTIVKATHGKLEIIRQGAVQV